MTDTREENEVEPTIPSSEIPLEVEDEEVPTEEEPAQGDPKEDEPPKPLPSLANFDVPAAVQGGGAPPWAKIPSGMKFPRGRQIMFVRIRAELTDAPWKGERQCICWSINLADERIALKRAMGDSLKLTDELTKQMIRSVDGFVANWDGLRGEDDIEVFWAEIGRKGRTILQRLFTQHHIPNPQQVADFFENCIAVRVASSG